MLDVASKALPGDACMVLIHVITAPDSSGMKCVLLDHRHIFGNNFGFVSLDILNLTTDDAGVYTCRAINAAGEAVTTATLRCYPRQQPQLYNSQFNGAASAMPVIIPQQVQTPAIAAKPKFSKQLKNIDGARESSTAIFEAQIEPADDQLMKVEW